MGRRVRDELALITEITKFFSFSTYHFILTDRMYIFWHIILNDNTGSLLRCVRKWVGSKIQTKLFIMERKKENLKAELST